MGVESRNPADDDSLLGAFRIALRKHLQATDDLLPAQVVSYDRKQNRATVQPIIQVLDTDGNRITRAQNTNLPVLLMGGGNFLLSFHLPPGSLGWIKANDRDISLFLQSHQLQPPNTLRMHSFEDALFIPDVMTGYTIDSEDEQAAVIQSMDGTVKVSLTDDKIKIKAPMIELEGANSINMEAQTIDIKGKTTISGQTAIIGQTTVSGNFAATGTMTNNRVDMGSDHTHEYTPGSGSTTNTGPPK